MSPTGGGKKERDLLANNFRMGCVQVIDGEKHRGGAAASESFTTFTQSLEQRLTEKIAESVTQMRGELDARLNEQHRRAVALIDQTRSP